MRGPRVSTPGCDDDEAIEQRILAHTGGVPALAEHAPAVALSSAATDLIGRLLEPSAAARLGSVAAGGPAAMRQHPWFASISWEVRRVAAWQLGRW